MGLGRSLPGLMAPGFCKATYLALMPHELGYSLIGTRVDAVSLPITFRRSGRRVWLPIRRHFVAQCKGIDLPDCTPNQKRGRGRRGRRDAAISQENISAVHGGSPTWPGQSMPKGSRLLKISIRSGPPPLSPSPLLIRSRTFEFMTDQSPAKRC